MAEVINSLFGITPESLTAQREQALQEQAIQYAKMDPFQRATAGIYSGANRLGGAIGGMLGAQDPEMQKAAALQNIMKQANTTTPEGLATLAQTLGSQGFGQQATQAMDKAQAMKLTGAKISAEEALAQQRGREKAAADPIQKLIESGKYIPSSITKYQQTGNPDDLQIYEKPTIESKSEFERVLSSLNLDPTQERQIKQQWVQAKLNPDSSGLRGLQAQMLQTQLDQRQLKLESDREKSITEKTQAVSKLSSTESNIDTALNTAEKALKLAPNSLVGGLNQAVSSAIPWTDSKALANLVGSLNSEKAIGTLEELKSQSRTGATGFGALSEKELALILNKTRALDPTDKLFKENLAVVMDGWSKIRNQVRESRLNLQGKKEGTGGEDLITRTMKANPGKTREQVTQKLRDLGKL